MRLHTDIRTVTLSAALFWAAVAFQWDLLAQGPKPATNVRFAQVSADDMKGWLGYLASDQRQGRQVFTEGYGLAAQYVASHLAEWRVKPLGAGGTYLQPVKVRGYKATRNSSITVNVQGESKTFKHGDHVTFAANSGGKQTLTYDGVEFLGYGRPEDYEGRNLKGKLIVTVPSGAPAAPGNAGRGGRGPTPSTSGAGAFIGFAATPPAPSATEQALASAQAALSQATAAVTQAQQAARGGRGRQGAGGRGAAPATPDFTTVQRLDAPVMPQLTGDETFFDALFSGGSMTFADVRAKAAKGEPLPPASLPAKVTVTIDNTYEVVSEQITHNVVGLIEGVDPKLRSTYVLVGAHLDHVGYSQTGAARGAGTDACRRRSPAAQAAVTAAGRTVQRPGTGRDGGPRGAAPGPAAAPPAPPLPLGDRDVISNGADDDASGSTALLAIAKAFATGPKPRRSIVVIWHAGEETGLYGSRYNADFPAVPLDAVQAQLNLDMVGRDDCDNIEGDFSNTLFIVGADRISTDLHNVIVETNATFKQPLTLDYELNDPADPENIYTRSDHYSYASKGVPIAFFTTGLHPDYHRVTDGPEKIRFDKMARIAQLVYESGFTIANSEAALARDNKGARTGFGTKAAVIPR